MIKCTGLNCPMQDGKVDPATCKAADTCKWATKPLTNADKYFRQATDEKLANKLYSIHINNFPFWGQWTVEQWLDWLKQEVKDNA